MTIIKYMLALTAVLAAMVTHAGDSASFLLDTAEGTRIAQEGEAIPVAYSPHWNGAASCTVTEIGRAALVAATTEAGSFTWTPSGIGGHTLTHTAGGETLTAQFTVLGDDVAVHEGTNGTIGTNETWGTNKVHLVTVALTVSSGVSLTIEAGVVVKFMPGTSLTVASGGSCTARGVIFTHVNDDTIGGDTMMDGDSTVAKMGDYTITGTITDDDSTEYRYMLPQTLTSSISSDTRLRGHRTYIVSNSVTVASGATLTLQPGTILKFNTGCSLTVNGTLDAQGTRAAPIVFTSLKDDEHGGDANGDGNKTYAQPGDWHQITGSGTVKLNYCKVLWCCAQNDQGALYPNGGTWQFDNSIVAHCQYDCMRSYGGTFTARNSVFMDSSMGAAPSSGTATFINCVFNYLTTAVRWGNGTFRNCIFSDISEDIIDKKFYSSTLNSKFYNCCFWNPEGTGDHASAKVGQNGCIYADPLFVLNPRFVDFDNVDFCRIAANSPCVDAGDGTFAPETDYYGQPRMDVKRIKDTGTPNGDGVCPDIGIYEVPGTVPVPLPDLAVVVVNALAARSTSGDMITVNYVVTNRGVAAASGLARDLFRFKGADASLGGQTIDAAEIQQAYNIAAGASVTQTATITVPMLKAGKWKVVVAVNTDNYPYEQNLSNNSATTEDAIDVGLEAMGIGTQSVTVGKGELAGFVLPGLPLSGGVVRVAGMTDALAVYGGNGAVPNSRTGGSPVQGGTTEPAVLPLQDGSLLIVFPARAEGENAYLVLENGGNAAATVSVEVREMNLALYGATPGRIANTGEATVTITGSGLSADTTVSLGGRAAKSVERLNAAQIAATFDVEGMADGVYDIAVSIAGAAGPATLHDAVEIYAAKMGPKLRAWLEVPSSVRDGRVFTGYVCYANEGDSPMMMPVFKVAREDFRTKMGLVASEGMTETTLYVGGISPTHPAGVLKAGDEARIPFYFQPFGTYKINLSHITDAEDLAAYPTFGGTKAYLAAMSAAATRLNMRGRTAYDIHDFVDQALWEKNGVACAAASGYLMDAKTGGPLANADISLVWAGDSTNLPPATATTDEAGYFQLTNLADGEYRWLLDGGNMLASTSTNTVTIAGQSDLNGLTVHATPGGRISGYVLGEDGAPVAGVGVARTDVSGGVLEVVVADDYGAYRFAGLPNGTNVIRALATDGWATTDSGVVVIDEASRSAEVSVFMRKGGVVSGVVTKDGQTFTNGFVRAIAQGGEAFNVMVGEDGSYLFDGLIPGRYQIGYYSATDVSDDAYVTLVAGDTATIDLAAAARPLFEPALRVGFGKLETAFFFTDPNRATNVVAWAWDFDSDGSVDSTSAMPTWTYTKQGTNTVTLTITEVGGARTTSVYPNCVRVEEAVETILKSGAIVFGTNSGTLETFELEEDTLVLSGSPSVGDIAVGNAILGKFNDTWYIRRVTGISRSGDIWTLTTEKGKMTDVYEQFAMAISIPAESDVPSPRPSLLSAGGRSPWLQASTRGADEDGFRLFAEGGVTAKVGLKPDFRFSLVQDIRNGREYSMWAFIGESAIEASIGVEGNAGARLRQSVPIPFSLKVPTSVPFLVAKAEAEVYAQFTAQISGTAGIHGHVTQMMQIGMERYDDEDWKWLKPFPTPEAKVEPYGDVEGSLEARMGIVPKFGLEWLAISATVDLDIFMSAYIKAGLKSPVSCGVEIGADLKGEADLKVFNKNVGQWFTPSIEGPRFQVCRYVGPEPEFTFNPSENLEAPAGVQFTNQTKGPRLRVWMTPEVQTEASRYEWDFGNGMKSTERNPYMTFTKKGSYNVSLKAFDDEFITGPYRYKAIVSVGEKNDDGGPPGGPSAPGGDGWTGDGTGSGTSNQSCDPNEMVGDEGVGDKRYVMPGQELIYTIYFENKEGFDIADAQDVKVTNPLSEWLDWSTFEMRDVAFNNQNDNSLDGFAKGSRDIKMNGTDKYVRVSLGGGEDGEGTIAETGVVHWRMRVYDPNGLLGWPNDGSGFLPSNDDTHRGEGHLTYRIKVRDDAPSNVVITNSASIVFDFNDPIETDPAWWNTVGVPGARFAADEVVVDEGDAAEIRVSGGSADATSSVQLYMGYNTAAAADLDLAKGTVDGVTPKGGLKFLLTLNWAKGEIGEKVITIPVKTDKTIEDDEFFTLQLAAPQGMSLGDATVCTVTINDLNDKTLKATVTAYKPKAGETVATNSVTVASGNSEGGFVAGTGEYTSGSKLTLTAEARPGWTFKGWSLKDGDGTIISDKAKFQVVVTNDAEYVAVFEDIPYVRGLADPAEGGKVTGSGYCAAGKKVTLKATANKNFTFIGWRKGTAAAEAMAVESGNGESASAEAAADKQGTEDGFVATTPSLVVDRTAKPAASSKTSTTITNVTDDVTYYAVFKSYPEVFVTVEATDGAGAEPTGKGAGKYVAGTITGMGKYAIGKTKIALKATANKDYVFVGWYDSDGELFTKDATYTIAAMGEEDVEYTAKFITAKEDKASVTLKVDSAEMRRVEDSAPYQTNVWAGVYLEWPVAADALSQTTVKVSGLPSGLKFTAKPVTSKIGSGKTAVVVTNVPANTIYGAPTAASKTDKNGVKPSDVKITVTTAGKSSITYLVKLTVDPLPAWVVGSFDGPVDGDGGTVSLTIATSGKISGKILEGGKTWTLSAGQFNHVEHVEQVGGSDVFYATVVGKAGKEVVTNSVVVAAEDGVGVATGTFDAQLSTLNSQLSTYTWTAWQNLWKRTDTKAGMPVFKKNFEVEHCFGEVGDKNNTVKFTFKKDGVVSFSGKKDGVSVSGSAQIVLVGYDKDDAPLYQITVYAPPKPKSKPPFDGWCETFPVKLTMDEQNIVTKVELGGEEPEMVQLWEGGPYWATKNIGAEKPEDYGYYFWWGDTLGYKWENEQFVASDGSVSGFSFEESNAPTYNKDLATLQSEGWITSDGVLSPAHDAAQVHWGGKWRTPTKQELDDLCYNKCDWTWTTQNGVNGYVVRGRGDYASNSIFIPCAGYGYVPSLSGSGSDGYYWSSVPNSGTDYARLLCFDSGYHDTFSYGLRYYGFSVRPVQGFAQ